MPAVQFEHLCIHAHSLAELALRQSAQAALAGLALAPPAAAPDADGLAHRLAALDLDALDFAALDGLDLGPAAADGPMPEPAGIFAPDPPARSIDSGDPADPPGSDGMAAYLAQAYAAAPRVRDHFHAGLLRVDSGQLAAWLAALPDGLPALTAPMDADGLGAWLACYQQGHGALTDLVCELRRIDWAA